MDKLTSVAKGGWHPERTGSVRGDIKSWVGRGDNGTAQARERAQAHNTTPLSALKSFAPPPKHTGFYPGSDASAADVTESPTVSSSGTSRQIPIRSTTGPTTPARSESEAAEEEAPPSGPFVVDTTGLSTAHLPKPPVKRVGTLPPAVSAERPAQRSTLSSVTASSNPTVAKVKKPGPALPPRLPPRSAVAGNNPITPSSPPPSYSLATASPVAFNQDAISRLGAAGVSVPEFNITPNRNALNTSHATTDPAPGISDVQSRIAALGSASVAAQTRTPDGLAMLASKKKPMLPPNKPTLPNVASSSQDLTQDNKPQPPPIPLSTKPR